MLTFGIIVALGALGLIQYSVKLLKNIKEKIKFVKMNVLETPANREIAIHHGIMSTPTLMFFCEGRPVGQALGFMPKEHLKKLLDNMLEKHRECIKQSTKLNT